MGQQAQLTFFEMGGEQLLVLILLCGIVGLDILVGLLLLAIFKIHLLVLFVLEQR